MQRGDKPKIADYPFTTLIPNLGVVKKPTGDGTVFADIPGLIEGASMGAGLGHEFLRHIERTRLLLHLIDVTDMDPVENYRTIQNELEAYGHDLAEKPQVLALNKVDAVDLNKVDAVDLIREFKEIFAGEVFLISAVARVGLDELMAVVWERLEVINKLLAEVRQ
ncbi:MAG: hypothetical protein F6K35_36405 [Okeania sp. SIO2H7]|nr:hypothetical protein [Okeania sp. SIO2H7]